MTKVGYFIAEYQTFTGSQKSLLYSIHAWQREGGKVIAILPGEGLCAQMLRHNGVPVIVCEAPCSLHLFQRQLLKLPVWKKTLIYLREVIPYSWRISVILKKENCQLLHCNSPRSALIAAWLPNLLGITCITHLHGKPVGGRLLWGIAQALSRRIIVVAKHLITEVYPWFRSKVRLLYNAIKPVELESLSVEHLPFVPPFAGAPLVVSLSSIVPRKGIHHLVKAAALVNRRLKATFVVAGAQRDRSYESFVKKLATELCPDSFIFLPWIPNPYPLLKQSDIAVLSTIAKPEEVPSDNPNDTPTGEGLPRFILEAMALKKPVVATRVNGCDEAIIDGETGFLVPPADPKAIAEAIEVLLENPELAKRMGEKGRERVEEHFSPERHQRALAGIYSEILGRG